MVAEGDARNGVERRIEDFKAAVTRYQANDALKPWQKVSAAIGIADYEPGRDSCTENVLKRADAAMYQNKLAMKAQRTD